MNIVCEERRISDGAKPYLQSFYGDKQKKRAKCTGFRWYQHVGIVGMQNCPPDTVGSITDLLFGIRTQTAHP